MLSIFVLFSMVVILAVLNLKRRKGDVLPKYDPQPETMVGVRDLKHEAFVQANYFLTPRQRVILKQAEIFPRKPFQVQSPV
jgi:hypothetical protein